MKDNKEIFTGVDYDTMQRYMEEAHKMRAQAVRDFFSAPFKAFRSVDD